MAVVQDNVLLQQDAQAGEGGLTVFTFWAGSELFGVDVAHLLSVTQELNGLHRTPLQTPGLLGVVEYRGTPMAVYNFARLLGIPSGEDEKKELIETLHAREQDHIDWMEALARSLREDVPFTKARDPSQCAFGRWYAQFTTRDENLAEILERLDEPHKRIHALADELLTLKEQGRTEEALERLELERVTTLRTLRQNLDHARQQIRANIRPVVLNLTLDGHTPLVGIQVDEVNNVIGYGRDDLTDLERLGLDPRLADLFSGYLSQNGENNCLLLSPERLLAHVGGGPLNPQ